MTASTPQRPAFISSVIYKDNRAALKWLQKAFGFEPSEVLTDAKDNIVHAEMTHGDGVIMIGNEFTSWARSPDSVGGTNTQRVHVRLEKGIDEHCARARAAGARVAMDPEGHHWTFAQTVKTVTFAEMEQATGFKFKSLT